MPLATERAVSQDCNLILVEHRGFQTDLVRWLVDEFSHDPCVVTACVLDKLLTHCRRNHPDCLILLPGPDPVGAMVILRRLVEEHGAGAIPFLIVAAESLAQALEQQLNQRAVELLPEPELTPVTLRRAIQSAIDKGDMERALGVQAREFRQQRADLTAGMKATLAALTISEERLSLAVKASGDSLWDYDLDAGRSIRNDRWKEMRGYRPNEIGETLIEWSDHVHPDDRERVIAALQDHLEGRTAHFREEYRILCKDGGCRWISDRGEVVARDANGAALRIVGFETDITERKWLETERQKFVSLADSSLEFIAMCDLEFRPVYVNAAGLRLLGLDSREAACQVLANDFFFPEDRPYINEVFLPRVLREGHAEVEIRFRHFKTGAAIWMDYNVFNIRDAAGGIVGWATVSSNIHGRKLAEQALRDADHRKDEFLAMLAHELRNPLAPISHAASALQSVESSDPILSWSRGIIQRQVDHLARLVDDLLDVARFDRGKIALKRSLEDLATLVDRAMETNRPLIDARRHSMQIDLPCDPVLLYVDGARIAQVIGNLITNACKYTPDGGQIWLSARQLGDQIAVRVRDTGQGISAEMMPKVFDLFAQADLTLDRAHGGLGIGLTLVKQLVELHDGRVEARSEGLDQGSEFIVYLPLRECTDDMTRAAENDGWADSKDTGPLRILIVACNEDATDTLSMLLRGEGHDARTAHDGSVVPDLVRSFRPNAVFMDMGLPAMDGNEMARQLRAMPEGRDVRLIALSGHKLGKAREPVTAPGFDLYLTKPASLEQLKLALAGTDGLEGEYGDAF